MFLFESAIKIEQMMDDMRSRVKGSPKKSGSDNEEEGNGKSPEKSGTEATDSRAEDGKTGESDTDYAKSKEERKKI